MNIIYINLVINDIWRILL